MKYIRNYEDYWVDSNNNSWYARYHTEEQAISHSKSLVGCRDCFDCSDCINCISCRDCTSCIGCNDCRYCKHCEGCRDCKDCLFCRGCVDSENCICRTNIKDFIGSKLKPSLEESEDTL